MEKKISYLIFIIISFVIVDNSYSIDLSGPQSPAPYAVFSTINAKSPEKGHAAVSITGEKSGGPDFYRFSTQLAVGVTDKMEAGVNIPYVENDTSGVEDITLSFKHRFFEEGFYGPSVAYLLSASIGSGNDGLSTNGRAGLGLVLSKRVGPVNGSMNFIYGAPFDGALKDEIRFSSGIEFSIAHHFDVLAEIFSRKSHYSKSLDQLEARFGYRILYGDGVFATLGVGIGLNDKAPDYRVMASLSLSFQKKEGPIEKIYEQGE